MGYDNLKLEMGMYRQEGMSFTQVLESLDPSEKCRNLQRLVRGGGSRL